MSDNFIKNTPLKLKAQSVQVSEGESKPCICWSKCRHLDLSLDKIQILEFQKEKGAEAMDMLFSSLHLSLSESEGHVFWRLQKMQNYGGSRGKLHHQLVSRRHDLRITSV